MGCGKTYFPSLMCSATRWREENVDVKAGHVSAGAHGPALPRVGTGTHPLTRRELALPRQCALCFSPAAPGEDGASEGRR